VSKEVEMKAYSEDLRERVIRAWQDGKTQDWIAKMYRVSTGSIKRYVQRYQATGGVVATVQRRQEPRISRQYEPALRALVAREPLAKLEWYCAEWQRETGIRVGTKTMSRMLVRLGLRQKNDGGRT
jgi:transposase